MHTCSILRALELAPGDMSDYEQLAAHHYRQERPVAIKAVYVLRPRKPLGSFGRRAAGVIVYTMPNPRVELRTVATGGRFAGLDRQTELAMLNRSVRCIARVIVEPRLRGIGLATRLVRETMPAMNVPIVEALGVMPLVNPFLERAGMKVFEPRVPVEHVKLIEAFSAVQIEEDDLVSPQIVQDRLDGLTGPQAAFIERHIAEFLRSHGARRTMPPGPERTRYLLGKLAHRPFYYIWLNPLMRDDCGSMISDPQSAPSSIHPHTSTISNCQSEVASS
jgi:hypothetical protein